MIELTLDKTKELLAEAVAEKGAEYVYTNPEGQTGSSLGTVKCFYVHGDQPGCLVGHVLHKAEASLTDLAGLEESAAEDVLSYLYDEDYREDVAFLLSEAQGHQDNGVPWGEAVRRALADLER